MGSKTRGRPAGDKDGLRCWCHILESECHIPVYVPLGILIPSRKEVPRRRVECTTGSRTKAPLCVSRAGRAPASWSWSPSSPGCRGRSGRPETTTPGGVCHRALGGAASGCTRPRGGTRGRKGSGSGRLGDKGPALPRDGGSVAAARRGRWSVLSSGGRGRKKPSPAPEAAGQAPASPAWLPPEGPCLGGTALLACHRPGDTRPASLSWDSCCGTQTLGAKLSREARGPRGNDRQEKAQLWGH